MANQFSRRGPPDRIKKHHDEASKDKMRAEKLAQRLYKYAAAKGEKAKKYELSAVQVQAAKVLIERGKPALQAIEQKTVDEPPTETEIMAQLHSLLANPAIKAQVQAMLTGRPELIPDDVQPQQSSAATGTDDQ